MEPDAESRRGREERLQRLLDLGRALTSQLDLDTVLEQILDTARSLTGARYAAVGILDERRTGLSGFVTSGVSAEVQAAIGDLPRGRGVLGLLIDLPEPIRLHDVSAHPRSYGFPPGHPPMHGFLGAPIRIRGQAWGNLYLTEKAGGEDFDDDDVSAIVVLAEWAAVAIHNAHTFQEHRLRDSVVAAEAERKRWARELHDETLQGLGAIKLALSGALRAEPVAGRELVAATVEVLDREIAGLRRIITDLRPAALDELGLVPALSTLASRTAARVGLEVTTDFPDEADRLPPEVETTVYRAAQEALTNVTKHAGATAARVRLGYTGGFAELEVADNGCGFDPEARTAGFGLVGMRERVELAGGELRFERQDGWTRVRARVPVRR